MSSNATRSGRGGILAPDAPFAPQSRDQNSPSDGLRSPRGSCASGSHVAPALESSVPILTMPPIGLAVPSVRAG